MEVTHREDHVTHAVIGGGQSISMSITDDAMFMHMLSSTLYSDKILAVVRESLCNAWDAHIEAKLVDRPVEITLTNDKLTIRDHGLGIAHSQIGPIYGTYGASTKKHDGKQTGGFGLGCKSPFAYTDHFEVVSCHQGVKTVYRMTKSSAELNGKPGIVPLLSIPTDEEGLTMSLDIKDRADYQRFHDLIKRIVANGELNAVLNGGHLPIIEFSQMQHGYVITKEKLLENHSRVCLRYGNVVYPLEAHAEYRHDYERTVEVLEMLGNQYGQYALVLQAKPNTLSITPSRESLSMEDKTIKTVVGMLKKFLHAHHNTFQRECLSLVMSTNEDFVAKGKANQLLRSPSAKNLREDNQTRYNTKRLITDTSQAAFGFLSHTYPKEDTKFAVKDMLHRLTLMIKAGSYDKGLLQTFRREYRRQQSPGGLFSAKTLQWFQRHILAPLITPMQGTGLQPKRLMAYASTNSTGGWGYTNETMETSRFFPVDMYVLLPFLRKLVVLTHSQKSIEHRLPSEWNKSHGASVGFMTYIVPRSPKKIEEARAFFAQQNVVLVDLTLQIEKREVLLREKAIKASKLSGYPTLASSLVGVKYEQYEAQAGKGLTERVEAPLFYTFLHPSSRKHTSTRDLPSLDRAAARIVCDLWGDQGAVVFNEPAAQKLAKAGVPSIRVFIKQKLEALMADKEVIKFLGVSPNRMKNCLSTDKRVVIDAVDCINASPVLYAALKLGLTLSPEKARLMKLWEHVQYNDDMRDVRLMVKNIPLHKKITALLVKLKASQALPLLDVSTITERLADKDPAVVDHTIKFFLKALKD
jgi:hypothetical protein